MQSEPALIIGALIGIVEAVLAALAGLGVFGADVPTLVLPVLAAIGTAVQAVWTRNQVYAPDTMRQLVKLGGE